MKKCLIFIPLIMVCMGSFGDKLATLPELLKPYALIADNEQLYVCEGATIYIYSLKDFSLKGKFGKEGEGPQEFKLPPSKDGLFVLPQDDYLLISSIGKASFYSKDGKFIKEKKTGASLIGGLYQPIGSKFAGLGMSLGNDQTMTFTINLYDAEFTKIKEIYKQNFMKRGSMTFPMVYPIFFAADNKIIAPGGEEFVLNIFDADGKKESSIIREYKRLEVTEDYKKGVHHYFKTDPNTKQVYDAFIKNRLKFSDYFPAIQFFFVDDGKIYIITYMKKNGKYEFFIYDMKGKFVKRLFLPINYSNPLRPDPFTIKHNKSYQLIENEDEEEWELHAFTIE